MKRTMMLAGMIAAVAFHAAASRRVSVQQLQELLAADDAAHRADLEVAHQIGELDMTERLTVNTLGHLAATHMLGPKTALALQLLSDQSMFLDPPASEQPATELPTVTEQRRMLDAARAYSVQTWVRMPNFFVTRVTNRFDDGPHVLVKGTWPVRSGLQPVGSSQRKVTFRQGKEILDTPADSSSPTANSQREIGLHSWGEFGPELTVVLADIANREIAFEYWEQIGTRLAAVFRYTIPRASSHYSVSYCCLVEQVSARNQFGYGGGGGRGQSQVFHTAETDLEHTYTEIPGYHGTIAIDPATGAVLRISIQAELSKDDPLLRAETMVEYGPVKIGDREFICPTRSLAISVERSSTAKEVSRLTADNSGWQSPFSNAPIAPILLINETSFVDYHRLGSSARILTEAAGTGAPSEEPSSAPVQASASGPSSEASQPTSVPAPAVPTQSQEQPVAADAQPTPLATTPATVPAAPVLPEVSMSAAESLPDRPTSEAHADTGSYSLRVISRLVDVGLVAYDKKGHPITDLKPDELEVYDNGKKQEIRSFALAGATPAEAPAQAPQTATEPVRETQEPSFSNHAAERAGVPAAVASDVGSTILVIDESHIAWADLSYARGQILKFLGGLAPEERVGLYTMTGLGFRVLTEVTTDHGALIARMQKFMPSAQSLSQAQEEENRNRQHFDEVHHPSDLNSVNGNHIETADAGQIVDPQLLTMGDDPARASFIILAQVARHLASIPGHKKVVWVSSDNVLADWMDQAVAIDKSPKDATGFALRVQEAMNEAHAAVYPFDVSQLEGGAVEADLQHEQVQLTPAAQEAASLGGGATPRNTGPGRIQAAMSQDLHPVQGEVRQVAAATGGRVIRRSGDLTSQLDRIVADGHATYMLSFSPQGPADGLYHTINVKLSGRHGLTLSYRAGYVFEKEPATLKERFQQAVWRPADMSEIAVSAGVSSANDGANVKINIAARDLGMQQQGSRWMDRLDIFFIQRDDAGLHARVEGQTLGLRLKPSTYERLLSEGVPFEHFVAANPGMGSLRVLVVDENSGRMGSVTIPSSAMGRGQ